MPDVLFKLFIILNRVNNIKAKKNTDIFKNIINNFGYLIILKIVIANDLKTKLTDGY